MSTPISNISTVYFPLSVIKIPPKFTTFLPYPNWSGKTPKSPFEIKSSFGAFTLIWYIVGPSISENESIIERFSNGNGKIGWTKLSKIPKASTPLGTPWLTSALKAVSTLLIFILFSPS